MFTQALKVEGDGTHRLVQLGSSGLSVFRAGAASYDGKTLFLMSELSARVIVPLVNSAAKDTSAGRLHFLQRSFP